jgi:hypothetical protein
MIVVILQELTGLRFCLREIVPLSYNIVYTEVLVDIYKICEEVQAMKVWHEQEKSKGLNINKD